MISDDDLLLYHYRDGLDAADRARIGAALAEQPEVAQRLHKLVARLDAVAAIPEVPVPEAAKLKWKAAIEQAAARGQTTALAPPKRPRPAYVPWLAAAAVVLVAVVSVLQFNRQPAAPETAHNALAQEDNSAYERGLNAHLVNTERQLASLETATPEDRSKLVDTIIEQNRIYALAAERAGKPQLARVLRAFTPILQDLAKDNGDASANVAQLAFELRVTQGRLGAAPTSDNQTTTL
ncbi:MAG TPA: hypothetical protein VMF52_03405 [Steroidobacteraceae bacterium]|nr:hypothetical protein [Steroidobacteraceae bacterium]